MDFLKTLLAYVALTVAFSVQEGPLPQDVPTPAAERDGIPDSQRARRDRRAHRHADGLAHPRTHDNAQHGLQDRAVARPRLRRAEGAEKAD
mgnify:CR=1 FL=1